MINTKTDNKCSVLSYATKGSSALDLRACINKTLRFESFQTILLSTGISIYINDPNISAIILPRSGLGHNHGIILGNSVGLIDSDYQGEIMVSLLNRSKDTFYINPGDRIAQIMFLPVIRPVFKIVDHFKEETKRGKKGFGHSGNI